MTIKQLEEEAKATVECYQSYTLSGLFQYYSNCYEEDLVNWRTAYKEDSVEVAEAIATAYDDWWNKYLIPFSTNARVYGYRPRDIAYNSRRIIAILHNKLRFALEEVGLEFGEDYFD